MLSLNLFTLLAAAVATVAAIPNGLSGTAALELRNENEWKFCGVFATADRDGLKRLRDDIRSCTSFEKGGYGATFEVDGIQFTDPKQNSSCVGIGCDTKTFAQVWLCNDTTDNFIKTCTEIADWMDRIINECCTDTASPAVSGQYFLGDGTNIAIGRGNCKVSYPGDFTKGDGQCLA